MKRSLRYIDCCDSVVKKIIVSLLCLATVVLFSCAKMTLEPEASVAAGSLSIVVENFTEETGSARSIAPTQLTAAQLATGYTLKLTGSTGRVTLPGRTITLSNGRTTLGDIPDGEWHLTLQVYQNTAPTVPILRGDTTVSVKNNMSAEARFTLSPVEGGTGTVRLTVNWQDADRYYVQSWYHTELVWSLAMYDVVTGAMIPDTESKMTRSANNTAQGNPNDRPMPLSVTYTGDRFIQNVGQERQHPAGKYELRLTLKGGNLPAGVVVKWSDVLFVEPGRQTTGNITIPRLIQKPNAPATFSENCTNLTSLGNYTATLTWAGVYNASNYELEIMKYATGTQRPTNDITWATAAQTASVYTYNTAPDDPNNYTNPTHPGGVVARYQSGGLLSGQTSIVFNMNMKSGDGFTARIRAVNGFGNSDWKYLTTPLVPTAPLAPSNFKFTVTPVTAADSFTSTLSWTGGMFDANGTYELELQRFTGGTKPANDATWTQSTGRTSVTYTTTTRTWTNANITAGNLSENDSTVTLTMNNTGGYYAARIRARNSEGGTSGWVYLTEIMIPPPSIVRFRSTRGDQISGFGANAPRVWHTWLTIHGPQQITGVTKYQLRWIKWGLSIPTIKIEDEATWNYLKALSTNSGSNEKGVWNFGLNKEVEMKDMDLDCPFLFCIRTETNYGNSPWFFYDQDVVQAR